MDKYIIDKIKTGKGLAGSRVALIFAPADAPPGSLVTLTRFLNQQEHLRAVPGYHGPNQNHVLRVSGLKSDEYFIHLLHDVYPGWLEQRLEETRIYIDPEITTERIKEVDHFPHQPIARQFVKENANTLAGLGYMLGNVGLLYSAWRETKHMKPHNKKHDWFKLYSSGAYICGSTILLAVGRESDNPRDVYTIMEELYPRLKQADDEQREHVHSLVEKSVAYIRNHPWEISSAIFGSGALAHFTSAMKRSPGAPNAKFEALSAFGTMTAMAIAALVPEKEGREVIDISEVFQRQEKDSMMHSVEQLQRSEPQPGHSASTLKKFTDWVQESPLAISAGIQAISNVGYLVAGIKRQPRDPGLIGMSAGYLAGNAAQTQASKGRGPGFDDVVTAAANMMRSDPAVQHMSTKALEKRILKLADALSDENEIVHKKGRMAKAIRERLERAKIPREEENEILTGFIPSERRVLKDSPFVRPRYVERILNPSGDSPPSDAIPMIS